MLFKLQGRKSNITDLKVEVGAAFRRYIYDDRYDKGEVTEIRHHDIVVDFLDTIRAFPKQLVTLVYGYEEETLMFYGEGTILKDYRGKMADTVKIERLEDLLDFDKWMV